MAKESKLQPGSKLGEILKTLQDYNIATYTGEDEGYDYLDEGDYCITVLNPSGDADLYIDLEDGFTLTCGEWDAHYEPYPKDYRNMMEDIRRFLEGGMYLAVVSQGADWICSLSVNQKEPDKAFLLNQLREFLHSADCDVFIREIGKRGASVNCIFWNSEKCRTIRVRPGDLK